MHAAGPAVAGRDLGAVPRLPADRPRRGLRHHAHLGERRHHRPVRRDALRRQRREVPLQGPVPADGHFNAGTLNGEPVEFLTTVHGPVVGYATVNGEQGRDLVASARATARTSSTSSSSAASPPARSTARSPSSRPRRRRRRPSTRSTSTTSTSPMYTSGRLPIRPPERRPRPADPGHGRSTSGGASCPTSAHIAGRRSARRDDDQLEQHLRPRLRRLGRQLGRQRLGRRGSTSWTTTWRV